MRLHSENKTENREHNKSKWHEHAIPLSGRTTAVQDSDQTTTGIADYRHEKQK
jgi:hypothetical protein